MLNACYIKMVYIWCCCCWHAAIFLLFVSHLFTLYFLNIVDALHNNLCRHRSVELKHLKLNFALATTTTWGKSSFFVHFICSFNSENGGWRMWSAAHKNEVERKLTFLWVRACVRETSRVTERKSLRANKFPLSRVMYSNVALFHVYCCQLNWNYLLAARMDMALWKSRLLDFPFEFGRARGSQIRVLRMLLNLHAGEIIT